MRASPSSLALLFLSVFLLRVVVVTAVPPFNGSLENLTLPPPGFNAVLNVGVILPDPTMTSETRGFETLLLISEFGVNALKIAANDINQQNLIPGVYVNLLFKYSSLSPNQSASEIFSTTEHVKANISALIGDILSDSTEYSAVMTGELRIPQCSFASSAVGLSDKSVYPYFFRTDANNYRYAEVMGQYVLARGWTHVGVLSLNNDYGTSFAIGLNSFANSTNLTILTERTIYQMPNDDPITDLNAVKKSGATIILFFANNNTLIIETLRKAKEVDMLNKDYVWVIFNNIQADVEAFYRSGENGDPSELDGLVMIDELFNLTGIIPEYDTFVDKWLKYPNMNLHGKKPDDLSFYQGKAYSCLMVLARGFNKSFDAYPGGRATAIYSLANQAYDTRSLTPTAFNTNYTGPAGPISFNERGDINSGNFAMFYLWNGTAVQFGTNVANKTTFQQEQRFCGNTTISPTDVSPSQVVNLNFNNGAGIALALIASIGIALCLVAMVIVIVYRNERVVKAASPLFCCVELLGLMLGYLSVFMLIQPPTSPLICILRPTVMSFAFVLVISGIILKSYRIFRIFNNVFAVRVGIKDSVLARFVLFLVVLDAVLIILWFVTDPPLVEPIIVQPGTYYYTCMSEGLRITTTGSSIFEILLIAYMVALGLYAVYLAYKTRNVSSAWSEAKWIAYVSYNVLLAGIICLPTLFFPATELVTSAYLRLTSLLYAATFTLFILFLPKLHELFRPYSSSKNSSHMGGFPTFSFRQEMSVPLSRPNAVFRKSTADMMLGAHEGTMPVKKQRKGFGLFSSWYMRKIVVIPSLGYFILVDEDTLAPKANHYTSAEIVQTEYLDEHILKVYGSSGHEFLLQVKDASTASSWLGIFNGRTALAEFSLDLNPSQIEPSGDETTTTTFADPIDSALATDKARRDTFGEEPFMLRRSGILGVVGRSADGARSMADSRSSSMTRIQRCSENTFEDTEGFEEPDIVVINEVEVEVEVGAKVEAKVVKKAEVL